MWLRSLQGQMMLAIALALLIAQGFSATLIWHEVHQRHIAMLVNGAAMRMAMANDRANGLHPPGTDGGFDPHGPADARSPPGPPPVPPPGPSDDTLRLPRVLRVHIDPASPVQAGDRPLSEVETALRDALVAQGESPGSLVVVERDAMHDPLLRPAAVLDERDRCIGGAPVAQQLRLDPLDRPDRHVDRERLTLQRERAPVDRIDGALAVCRDDPQAG